MALTAYSLNKRLRRMPTLTLPQVNILRSEMAQLRDKKASVDPNAADPQMQMLVGLRERLRSSNP